MMERVRQGLPDDLEDLHTVVACIVYGSRYSFGPSVACRKLNYKDSM
jgi:hypothetical protein